MHNLQRLELQIATFIQGRVHIGHHTVIGGNIWLTHDVPALSRILQRQATVEPYFQDGAGIYIHVKQPFFLFATKKSIKCTKKACLCLYCL